MHIYRHIFRSAEVSEIFSDEKMIDRMLHAESALVKAQSRAGLIPEEEAKSILSFCRKDKIEMARIKQGSIRGGNPVIPLIDELFRLTEEINPNAAKFIHQGTTSQDIMDTAAALAYQTFNRWLDQKLHRLSVSLSKLTLEHRESLMIGRTLLQHASPITFGLKTAGWLDSVGRSKRRLSTSAKSMEQICLQGPVGRGNKYLNAEVRRYFAEILGLKNAIGSHTHRDVLNHWASCLGILNGSLGKIAKDISLMMQTELSEVSEGRGPGQGASSSMPHKQNPVICSLILANTARIPGLVATMFYTIVQEHERSAGLWHAEWETVAELAILTGGSLQLTIDLIENLEVNKDRMRSNIELTKGLVFADVVASVLGEEMGRKRAKELIAQACETARREEMHLRDVVRRIIPGFPDLNEIFDPGTAIKDCVNVIDGILKKYEDLL